MFTRSDSLFSDFSHCWLSLLWCHWPDCISPWMKISASKLPLTKETKGRLICDGDSTGELVNGVVILKMYMHAPKKRYLCLCVCECVDLWRSKCAWTGVESVDTATYFQVFNHERISRTIRLALDWNTMKHDDQNLTLATTIEPLARSFWATVTFKKHKQIFPLFPTQVTYAGEEAAPRRSAAPLQIRAAAQNRWPGTWCCQAPGTKQGSGDEAPRAIRDVWRSKEVVDQAISASTYLNGWKRYKTSYIWIM